MKTITDIDKNFTVRTAIQKNDIRFYDVKTPPFAINGVFYENGRFRRIPETVAEQTNPGVMILHTNTAGGRVRFRTDSPYIAIHAEMPSVGKMPHFALTGAVGFDLYIDNEYRRTFIPPFDITDGFESVADLPGSLFREITIHFPTYSDVSALYIGLAETAAVEPPAPYTDQKPIVYYGSSITQGGCVSRPGLTYEAILSRRFNIDHLNLGFSGSAKGELPMAEYISRLEISVFVLDYDHNAETPEMLRNTHERLFRTVRGAQPTLPVIMMPRPKFSLAGDEEERRSIVYATYKNAVDAGDRNVFFIDGPTLMRFAGNEGTVDDCHPNDLGFFSMAKAVGEVLEKIL